MIRRFIARALLPVLLFAFADLYAAERDASYAAERPAAAGNQSGSCSV